MLAAILAASLASDPDISVGAVVDIVRLGSASMGGETWTAYSWGSTVCNSGNQPLAFAASPSNMHPASVENLYRIKDGRFEQIGLSWVHHGFCALQQSLCGTCQPSGGGCPSTLGIGCSSPDSAATQGSQSLSGPRSIVQPATGQFPGTWTDPPTSDPSVLRERLRVRVSDLDPALNEGALYFAELHLIHPEDALAGLDSNNLAYREVSVGAWSPSGYALTWSAPAVVDASAIEAWRGVDPSVVVAHGTVAGDGRLAVAARVARIGAGYRYDYTVFNATCSRAIGAISISGDFSPSDLRFHAPEHHSGEPYSSEPWEAQLSSAGLRWSVAHSYEENPSANAIRWSTAYSFSFVSAHPPIDGSVTVEPFAPSAGGSDSAVVALPVPRPCELIDLDCSGSVDGSDMTSLLAQWAGTGSADFDQSGMVDGSDLAALLAGWTP